MITDGLLQHLCAIFKMSLLVYTSMCTYCTQQMKTVYAQGIVLMLVKVTLCADQSVNE